MTDDARNVVVAMTRDEAASAVVGLTLLADANCERDYERARRLYALANRITRARARPRNPA